jgi:HD-like signal output (HDOD) protein
MTSPRPFRDACTHGEAVARLEAGSGSRFDPEVVRAFCEFEPLARIREAIAAGPRPAGHEGFDVSGLTFDRLLDKVSCDLLLAARVLREANSGGGPLTTNLPSACSALGGDRLREVVSGGATWGELTAVPKEIWEHSLRAAEAARLIAEQTGTVNPEDAYTLGLLHDVGEALLGSLFPAAAAVLAGLDDRERVEHEAATYGVDHAQVGQWALGACGMPRALSSALQAHHDVSCANDPAALLLHVANAVANATDPFKLAALDTIGADRLYMLRLSRTALFRIHSLTGDALERRLNPVL